MTEPESFDHDGSMEPDDLYLVTKTISRARIYSLEAEVVLSALEAMKSNPSLSIADALAIGLREWDC